MPATQMTGSEVLINTLEDFGQIEPTEVIVIYTNANGDLVYRSNIEGTSMKIGMLTMALEVIKRRCFGS